MSGRASSYPTNMETFILNVSIKPPQRWRSCRGRRRNNPRMHESPHCRCGDGASERHRFMSFSANRRKRILLSSRQNMSWLSLRRRFTPTVSQTTESIITHHVVSQNTYNTLINIDRLHTAVFYQLLLLLLLFYN